MNATQTTRPALVERSNPRTGATEWRAYPWGTGPDATGCGPWTTDRDAAAGILAAAPVPLVLTDDAGTEWHATDDLGDRVTPATVWRAVPGHVTYRRQFRVAFPRYSSPDLVRAHVEANRLPWERVVRTSGEHWGGDDVAVTTELIEPSSTWCVDCARDVRPDQYHRTWACAVTITPAGTHRSYTVRNYSHGEAHELADRERAGGATATVGPDLCG